MNLLKNKKWIAYTRSIQNTKRKREMKKINFVLLPERLAYTLCTFGTH